MITVEEHQKTLSAKGINLPQAEVQKLLDLQYKLANLFFDVWVKKTKKNVVVGSIMKVHKENGNIFAEICTYTYVY